MTYPFGKRLYHNGFSNDQYYTRTIIPVMQIEKNTYPLILAGFVILCLQSGALEGPWANGKETNARVINRVVSPVSIFDHIT